MNLKMILPRDLRESVMFGLKFLPDELYIRLFFFAVTGKHLHLRHPVTFEDKQQWLKLHNKHPEYRDLVDKYKVREHIKHALGEEYLFPLLGAWQRFDDIDFDRLPNQFVLKCNHDSGSVRVIRDKSKLTEQDYQELRKHFTKRLKQNFFFAGREYPYNGIKPCILAEKYMIDDNHEQVSLNDYKFFCFNGEPRTVLIVTDRAKDCRYDFYDMDFHKMGIIYGRQSEEGRIKKPEFFDEMKEIAAKLSCGKKFVRIDLYEINGKVYFGEYTFFDGGGFQWLQPEKWEYELGSWLKLD